jgi:hypothetical protein
MIYPCASGFRTKFPSKVRKIFWTLYRRLRTRYSIKDPNLTENLFNEVDILDTNEKLYSKDNTRWKGLPRLIREVLQRLHEIHNNEEKLNKRPQSKISRSILPEDTKGVKLAEHYGDINYVDIPFNTSHILLSKMSDIGMNSI